MSIDQVQDQELQMLCIDSVRLRPQSHPIRAGELDLYTTVHTRTVGEWIVLGAKRVARPTLVERSSDVNISASWTATATSYEIMSSEGQASLDVDISAARRDAELRESTTMAGPLGGQGCE